MTQAEQKPIVADDHTLATLVREWHRLDGNETSMDHVARVVYDDSISPEASRALGSLETELDKKKEGVEREIFATPAKTLEGLLAKLSIVMAIHQPRNERWEPKTTSEKVFFSVMDDAERILQARGEGVAS